MHAITQNRVAEWSFVSAKTYADTFNEVELDFIFEHEGGERYTVPAFWAGGNRWTVRFSSPVTGRFTYRSVCSDCGNDDLNGESGEFEVMPYDGDNPLLARGRIRVAPDKRHFEHRDGTPLFWLADTWWMGLCYRLDWPDGFQTLALDRVRKGFSVVQIVAGLYPDMPAFDPRGANEAGFPWTDDFGTINPAYFDYADRRIAHLADLGIVPCIVACWGYYLRLLGLEKMKRHWRYLIARWGAFPVVWCLAGEATMPYYLSQDKEGDAAFQKSGWTELARYVRKTDPFGNLVTIHPGNNGRDEIEEPSLLDFDMLQTGHGDRASLPGTTQSVTRAYSREPAMPFINSEVCYEGIGEQCRQEVQRLMFWSCILGGAAGHTYGANGIWQVNQDDKPYGPSPHGMAWGNTPWRIASQLPGSTHVAFGKKLLERFEWWRFDPHPEWAEPRWTEQNYMACCAGGIPGETRLIYMPPGWAGTAMVKQLEQGVRYRAYLLDPVEGGERDLGQVEPDENGNWEIPAGAPPWKFMPVFQDWVVVLEKE